ncbi:hypothetical protein [Chryseobacterium sp. HSC-36S06]|uniref:hypothetical protein n=1 Tax=Chryseobacterium sp. HSC-36S06 TaxID=2910970 RepID=UPI00209EB3CD|nr:hypothetical protein [Chryseobacterium sp. HSC-36S06]MCP2037170.1 gas vesicle protein [Chryseobacterium sp. HSC-36S06]
MKKNYFRILLKILAILFLLILVVNFGINFWLKSKLPGYIKNHSHYRISYESLDVDLGTGNIFATGITVNNKNPENQNVIRIQGTVDTLSVSRLGIYDVLFRKRINSSNLLLRNPNLNIILAKPINEKTGKKRNPVVFENLKISGGTLQVFKHTKQKFISVHDLNLNVENLQMTEEAVENKLPVVFDQYDISGKNFFFRPDPVYAVTAKHITTKERKMSLVDFTVTPLLSQRDFIRFYPAKKNLYDFKTSEMQFTDIALEGNKVMLANAVFNNPELKIFTTNAKAAVKKDFTFDVNMEQVLMQNAKITVLKPNSSELLNAENISLDINKFLMNGDTSKDPLPFQYADFKISGKNIGFSSETESMKIAAVSLSPKAVDLGNISIKPTQSKSDKTLMDLNVRRINLKINEFKFVENKLKLNVENVLVSTLNGKISAADNPTKKQADFKGIHFPLIIKNIAIQNSNLVYDKGGRPLVFNDLNAKIQNLEMNAKTAKKEFPFKTGFYSATTRNFSYRTQFYNLSASLLKFSRDGAQISNFAMKPTVSRAQYIRMIPTEKDLYNLKVAQISMNGQWDLWSKQKFINASQLTLTEMNANIFRSKIPKDDLTEKPLYSKLLRSIKFPLYIRNTDIKNSVLEYEEDTKKSDGPGKLTFNNFNMNVKNLNSGKMKDKPTQVPINISCLFMNASPMNVKWNFDTANMSDVFSIAGNIADLPASRVNPFIEPYLKIRATGLISDLIFNFKGNNKGLNGILNMKHQDLRVSVLKETGEKNKVLSAVANIFVKTDSGKYPDSVPVDNIVRDSSKSFFNLFWKGIEEGLKKTLIGKNVENTEKTVKTTVENTKTALEQNKADIKETKQEVKEKAQQTKEKIKEKGLLRNIFRKKSEN